MKISELREKDKEELKGELERLRREHFVLRMQFGSGQLGQTHLIKQVKKNIAKIKTLMAERKLKEVASKK